MVNFPTLRKLSRSATTTAKRHGALPEPQKKPIPTAATFPPTEYSNRLEAAMSEFKDSSVQNASFRAGAIDPEPKLSAIMKNPHVLVPATRAASMESAPAGRCEVTMSASPAL